MKKIFLENLGLKIASVLLAIVLWIFVTSRGQAEMSIDVPLEFSNIPQGLEMVNHNIKMVTLTIKGQEGLIKNLKPSDVRVPIDLSKAKKGEGLYYIQRDDIKIPHGLTVTSIDPSAVKVMTAETVTKIARVVPVVAGEPQKGYHIKSIEVAPQTVIIEGIRSEISRIGNLKTEPVDVTGANETLTQDAKLDLGGRNVRSKTPVVSVRVVIGGPRK
jgi:YbbR domain-containing protein